MNIGYLVFLEGVDPLAGSAIAYRYGATVLPRVGETLRNYDGAEYVVVSVSHQLGVDNVWIFVRQTKSKVEWTPAQGATP